jgi:superfamily I DNA/RNA helicase
MDASKTEVILGPPGTGKTTYELNIVEQALSSGIRSDQIAYVSFTKKATTEAMVRAIARFSLGEKDLPYFRTLHSMAFRLLGLRREQIFGWKHIHELGRRIGVQFKGKQAVDEDDIYGMNSADRMLFFEGLARNKMVPLKKVWDDAMEDSVDWFELERLARSMTAFKQSRGLLDFTDILEKAAEIPVEQLPKFEYLIIDEGQDLSTLHWKFVERLAVNAKRVYVAGDDDQALYLWSGADVQRFISLQGRIKQLDVSYRIPRRVHEVAEAIAGRIANRRRKTWKSRDELGSINTYGDLDEIDMSKGTWLILARNGYMLKPIEDHCLREGWSFHSVNKDPLASPSLQAIKIWEQLRRGSDVPVEDVFSVLKLMSPSTGAVALQEFLKKYDPNSYISLKHLVELGLKVTSIWHEALTRIGAAERDYFIAARRRGEALLKQPRINISTIHSAKGGQADHTVLISDMSYRCHVNMNDDFDNEARVWYVAATRCMQSLNVILPKTNLNFEVLQ